jgi:hypothetical protein
MKRERPPIQLELDFSKEAYYADPAFFESINESNNDPDYLEYIEGRRTFSNIEKNILSLFDYTGNWAEPYHRAGYNVICMDIKAGQNVNDFSVEYLCEEWGLYNVYGILAGVPCTDFACSGARWFADKDLDGRTEASIELVYQTLRTIELFDPAFWCIENPVGRMPRLVPELDVKPWYFNPSDFARDFEGEDYTKKTGLWGKFVPPTVNNLGEDRSVFPSQGSKMHRLYGGKSEHTKTMRSITPLGFSQAFFECNQ